MQTTFRASPTWRTHLLQLVALAVGFAASLTAYTVYVSPEAHAVDSCLNGDYAVKGAHEDAGLQNSSGTRSDLYVPNGGVNCQHIASIYAGKGSGGAEFGWIRGWSSCEYAGADDQKYTEPTLHAWYFMSTGQKVKCKVYENRQPSAGFHTFRMSDSNMNGYWGPWIDGTELDPSGVALDFTQGTSWVAMERGNANDPGTAHWTQLKRYAGGNWYPWAGQVKNASNAGPGSYTIVSNTEGEAVE